MRNLYLFGLLIVIIAAITSCEKNKSDAPANVNVTPPVIERAPGPADTAAGIYFISLADTAYGTINIDTIIYGYDTLIAVNDTLLESTAHSCGLLSGVYNKQLSSSKYKVFGSIYYFPADDSIYFYSYYQMAGYARTVILKGKRVK